MKIKRDGGNIPKEVKIVGRGFTCLVSIWAEAQTMVVVGKEKEMMVKDQWTIEEMGDRNNGYIADEELIEHVDLTSNPTAGVGPATRAEENRISFKPFGLMSGGK